MKIYAFLDALNTILINFKLSKNFNFDCKQVYDCYDKYSFIEVKETDIKIDISFFKGKSDSEYISLEWLSNNIAYYLFGFKIENNQLILILNSITYHGLYGLLDLFEKYSIKEFTDKEKFYYFKQLAKYYRGLGDFEKSQSYYRKTIIIASSSDSLLAYALSLQSKQFSDYLQRQGLSNSFSKIAYLRAIKIEGVKLENPRWFQICIDSYAKGIFLSDPKVGERLYSEILKKKNNHHLSLTRIKYRYLELKIDHSIKKKDFTEAFLFLKEYENLLDENDTNTKVKYIRTIHFLKLVRKALYLNNNKINKKNQFVSKYLSPDDDTAISMLDDCIIKAYRYKDRKFIANAYYEKSYWLIDKSNENINDSIDCLLKGINIFEKDSKSIINKIYSNTLNRIANLYFIKKDWENASFYFKKLFAYLTNLKLSLDNDKKILDQYINNEEDREILPEFKYLSKSELRLVRMSLIVDYEDLMSRLIDFSKYINTVQDRIITDLEEIMENQNRIIVHDINRYIRLLKDSLKRFDNINEQELKKEIKRTNNDIEALEINIEEFKKLSINQLINPPEINLNEEFKFRIDFEKNISDENIEISIDYNEVFKRKFPKLTINRIVSNLFQNSKEIGIRNNIEKINIKCDLLYEENIIYLIFSDNCRDFNTFKLVIKKLNSGEKIISKSHDFFDKRGNGLSYIKKLINKYNNNKDWILYGDDEFKSLKIPLYIDNVN